MYERFTAARQRVIYRGKREQDVRFYFYLANSGRGKVLCGMPITQSVKPHQANILSNICFNILLPLL